MFVQIVYDGGREFERIWGSSMARQLPYCAQGEDDAASQKSCVDLLG